MKKGWKIVGILFVLILLAIVGYFGYSKSKVYISNWDTIQFAVEKPNLVRNLKADYASKSAQLEKSYSQKEPTVEEQLLQQVVNQMKQGK